MAYFLFHSFVARIAYTFSQEHTHSSIEKGKEGYSFSISNEKGRIFLPYCGN